MTGLQAVYSEAIRNTKAQGARHFYEAHHGIISRFADAYGIPVRNACVAFARLSPRTSVALNLKAFVNLLAGKPKPAGVLSANWSSAMDALTLSEAQVDRYLYGEPLTKVRAFARNLLLDREVITLDAIMLRILQHYYPIPTLNHLFQHYTEWHSAVYPAICELDPTVPPYQIQAVLWDYARRVYAPIPKNARLL